MRVVWSSHTKAIKIFDITVLGLLLLTANILRKRILLKYHVILYAYCLRYRMPLDYFGVLRKYNPHFFHCKNNEYYIHVIIVTA